MIRNLLSNALKYTKRGKVLLGCRRHEGKAEHRGLGYRGRHPGRASSRRSSTNIISSTTPRGERSRGLGLGLSIVQRLGNLLGHRDERPLAAGKGSVFADRGCAPAEASGTADCEPTARRG